MATRQQTEKARHPLDVPSRLDEFRSLRDGWADGMQYAGDWGNGYGKAPSHAGLDWLAAAFTRHYPADAPLPYTYPTPEGGVQMEWSYGVNDITLEIDLETRRGEWFWFERNSDAEQEKDLDLDDAAAWAWVGGEVSRMAASLG